MLSIYLKTSIRHLRKNRLYAFINMFGLAAGITAMLLAILYRGHETSYDLFHNNHENIYRITTTLKETKESERVTVGATGQVQGPAFVDAIPELKSYTRIMGGDIMGSVIVNNQTYSLRPLYVDSNFLEVFTFPLLQGNAATALDDKSTVVLTQSTALKMFGTTDVVGKLITMEADPAFEKLGKPLLISAIVRDPPVNSSLQFDMLFPFSYMQLSFTDEAWLNAYLGTFVVLTPSANTTAVASKFQEIYQIHSRDQLAANIKNYQFDPQISYGLQSIADIHLNPLTRSTGNAEAGVINGSTPAYSIIFLVVGAFILLMACINFVNINIAGSLKRAKEVGIRKVSGGSIKQIVFQFLTESSIICGMAFLLSLMGLYFLLPTFNELSGNQLNPKEAMTIPILFSFLVLLVAIVTTTGIYPAFILSRFKPAEVLYNKHQHKGKSGIGNLLVIVQFIPAIFLLITALIYYQQMNFVRTKSLGYNPEHVIKTGINGDRDYASVKAFLKNELAKETSIKAISFGNMGFNFHVESNQKYFDAIHKTADDKYLPLMEIPVLVGRNFSSLPSDNHSAIVNQAFVKAAGIEYPIGTTIQLGEYYGNKTKTIIGVVKDHHHESVRKKIAPLLLFAPDREEGDMWVKVDKNRMNEGLSALERVYKKAMPSAIYQYAFVDELNAREFLQEQRWQRGITIGTILSLLICCLGLFGLAHLSTWQRVKEIGIRKVLGASITQIMLLLSSGFLKMVFTSFLIASPIALLVMHRWLQDFGYRINIGAGIFLLAAVISVAVSLVAVCYQSFRAAAADPVRSLGRES